MDPVSTLLEQVRVVAARPSRLRGSDRWCLSFAGSREIRFGLVQRGEVWVSCGTTPPYALGPGDCFVVAEDASYTLATHAELSPETGTPICASAVDGVAEIGDGGATCVEGGQIELDHASWQLLSAVLPTVLVVPSAAAQEVDLGSALHRFFTEAGSTQAGAELAATRLAELVCLAALRRVLGDSATAPHGWLAAVNDPTTGPATRALYSDLGHPWSVAELAELTHVHPSTFAARFHEVTGESPAAFLTAARMRAGAAQLRTSDETLDRIAGRLGYSSEASFSRAFKRAYGRSPGRWRSETESVER